jgi:hypothetical protein
MLKERRCSSDVSTMLPMEPKRRANIIGHPLLSGVLPIPRHQID